MPMSTIGQNSSQKRTRTIPSVFSSSQLPMTITTMPLAPPPTWRDCWKIERADGDDHRRPPAQHLIGDHQVQAVEHQHHAEERDRQAHDQPRRHEAAAVRLRSLSIAISRSAYDVMVRRPNIDQPAKHEPRRRTPARRPAASAQAGALVAHRAERRDCARYPPSTSAARARRRRPWPTSTCSVASPPGASVASRRSSSERPITLVTSAPSKGRSRG